MQLLASLCCEGAPLSFKCLIKHHPETLILPPKDSGAAKQTAISEMRELLVENQVWGKTEYQLALLRDSDFVLILGRE